MGRSSPGRQTPAPRSEGAERKRLMPPSITRQPRARRYGRVSLAAAVALTVAVGVPVALHHDSDSTMVSAAADTTGSLTTSTSTSIPVPSLSERDDLPPHQGHPDAAATQTLRA